MQPRPRVLAVAQSAQLGGAERALLRIGSRLPEHGFAVEYAFPADGPAAHEARSPARLEVGGLDRGRWLGALAALPKARRAASRADVVLLNGIVTQRLAPAMTGATLVPYVHELVEAKPRAWRSQRFWRSTPLVLCACHAVAQRCRALGAPPDRLRTVYAPVESVERAARPGWAAGPVVGFVGQIAPHKGTLDLVRAMSRIDATLVLVGAGGGAYAEQVRSEAGPQTVFLGEIADARALMHWFDLLALPSHREAFGTVAAEALAAGTPVVATRGTGVEEYVVPGRNGELFMAGDVDALASKIRRVLPQASAMAEAARESAAPFATETVTAAVADAIHESLRRRGLA